jgi:hypothetical protein
MDAPRTHDTMLSELASLGMRAARVVTRLMEIELEAAEIIASWLPELHGEAASLGEAVAAGAGVDAVNAATVKAVPRIEALARALDRLSRSVRRSIGLQQRIEAGWPRAGSDDRMAMMRRQVARGVSEAIRREADGETAERLFDELALRLDDPGLDAETLAMPMEAVVRRICHELGLVAGALKATLPDPPNRDTS